MVEKKTQKEIQIKDVSTCEATQQMLARARRDGVETQFDRAASMKACPIGADSACCKHCAMGPCRINARDPYAKVGVCGATIDTIMARNTRSLDSLTNLLVGGSIPALKRELPDVPVLILRLVLAAERRHVIAWDASPRK